jgi:hypothetical protein
MRSMAAAVLALVLGTARGEVSTPPAALETTLRPGAFDELCVRLGPAESVRYAFDADAPMDFNIHWHRGEDVLYPVKRDAVARLGGRFTATEPQIYCLMWTHRGGAPAALRARVDRAD